ncbi:hypothetical protein HT031_000559 [Scenedesmus sp. PABB004]|nr:hypothetical protein HT031_000559 [Scenedesmus sp. PABB004]
MPALARATLALAGVPAPTELLRLPASAGAAALQLLVVPGNPGLASFYGVLLRRLHAAFGGAADVEAVSHLGHDGAGLAGDGAAFCLDAQIEHKVALLRQHVLAPGRPPAVVLGHSIGAFMMLEAIRRAEAQGADPARLPKVVLLMPFLATDWGSRRQRLLRWLSAHAPRLAAAAGAVGAAPAWAQRALLALTQPGVEAHAADSIRQLMARGVVHNAFHLAAHEFRDLDRPVDWEPLRRLGARAAVVCAPRDMWLPDHHVEQLRSELPDTEVHAHDRLSHAFCMEERQCEAVAALVRHTVLAALPQLAAVGAPLAAGAAPAGGDVARASDQASCADLQVLLDERRPVAKLAGDAASVAPAALVPSAAGA